jgi:predicted nucleic acid-binding protein
MIILDTNVLSALMQQLPDPVVVNWLDANPAGAIWISSITLFEARYGLFLMPEIQRKTLLQQRFEQLVQTDLANRVVVFDVRAAHLAAQLAAERKNRGRPVDMRDTLIAGIALAQGATLATRNARHFEDLPISVINPWASRFNTERVDHIYQDPNIENARFKLHDGDLSDTSNLVSIIQETQPDEIYNLAAQSHVAVSFESPECTIEQGIKHRLKQDDACKRIADIPGEAGLMEGIQSDDQKP